ncbi:hypothetical protein [Nocardia seriolae]|nr:hypothetical protein [Nocardia seriolae]MTJ61487.1 hypothetical protein [Nocardia seriolae]MTJ71661.1 hypothetical protein [Nocardia seriolae]MTK30513.1 hypothetical protein [Nocardia seriolae]MTK39458.1 hypothetical protein [Nocardia seriolae]MTK47082.1 hypothetical protein [Nocardia seriolae]
MSTITEVEHTVRALEITELHSTVAAHAATQIVDPHTLAVVVFQDHNAPAVEQTLRHRLPGTTEITSAHGIITLRI